MNRKGFTLIELMVVVLIMGILASMGIPYYYKTIETSRAGDAVALGHLIANANRMYNIDRPGSPISGGITNGCNTQTCTTATGACILIACSYVAAQDWNGGSYDFYACNGATGGPCCGNGGVGETGVSCARRKSGVGFPYANWGYQFYSSGRCYAVGGAPSCPKF